MRTSTKIWLIIAIITNVGMIYFFRPMIGIIGYDGTSIYLNSSIEGWVGLALFVIANIAGPIVFVRFTKTQPLNRQIFFSTVPPTITFMLIILFFFTITTSQQTEFVSAIRSILAIDSESARYIWMGIAAAIYLVYISVMCYLVSIPVKRVEKAIEILRYGRSKKSIKVGGGKQFKTIEHYLNAMNENYKDGDKLIKKVEPLIMKEVINGTSAKQPEPKKS